MAQNLQIDPVKKDYVFVNGSPVPSDSILEKSYIALAIPKNNWLYGTTDQGSLLYTLEQAKRTAAVEQLFAGYARDAIQTQLVATGQAQSVGVKNLTTSRTGTSNQIEVIPAAVSASSQLDFVSV